MLLWNGWKVGTGPFAGSFNFPSRVRERLKPEFLVSALMALMAPDFTSCFACSVAVAVSTTGCSDSERLTPPWLAVLLLLCFFRASNAFFFFFSLLNFFCRASSSSLSPGGITNMVAPGSGAGPKASFSTVTARGSHAVHSPPARPRERHTAKEPEERGAGLTVTHGASLRTWGWGPGLLSSPRTATGRVCPAWRLEAALSPLSLPHQEATCLRQRS